MGAGYTSRTGDSYVIERRGVSRRAALIRGYLGLGVPGMVVFPVMVPLVAGDAQAMAIAVTGLITAGLFVVVAAFWAGMHPTRGELLVGQPRRIELGPTQAGLTLDVDGWTFPGGKVRSVQLQHVQTEAGATNFAVAIVFDSLVVEMMFESATDARAIAGDLAGLLHRQPVIERDAYQHRPHGWAILLESVFVVAACGIGLAFAKPGWLVSMGAGLVMIACALATYVGSRASGRKTADEHVRFNYGLRF